MSTCRLVATVILSTIVTASLLAQEKLNVPPPGYTALFNGKDLTGWKAFRARPNPNKKNADGVSPLTMPRAAERFARRAGRRPRSGATK